MHHAERSVLAIVSTLLLATHLLAMNIASVGPLVGVWLVRPMTVDSAWRRRLSRRMLWWSLGGLGLGAALGGALLLLPNPGLRAALARFQADAYWFAGLEILFSAACMAGLIRIEQKWPRRRRLAGGLAIVTASNLLYHFPPLMAVIGELTADATWTTAERLDRTTLIRLWLRPEILALWAHFSLASLAVAAIAAIWPFSSHGETGDAAERERTISRLGGWALGATVLQLPVGMWLLLSADGAARDAMLGENLAMSLCFGAGVLGAIGLLQSLVTLTWSDQSTSAIRRVGWLLVAVTVLMSATLRSSRTGAARAIMLKSAAAAPAN